MPPSLPTHPPTRPDHKAAKKPTVPQKTQGVAKLLRCPSALSLKVFRRDRTFAAMWLSRGLRCTAALAPTLAFHRPQNAWCMPPPFIPAHVPVPAPRAPVALRAPAAPPAKQSTPRSTRRGASWLAHTALENLHFPLAKPPFLQIRYKAPDI